jgi:hypothetical protein
MVVLLINIKLQDPAAMDDNIKATKTVITNVPLILFVKWFEKLKRCDGNGYDEKARRKKRN